MLLSPHFQNLTNKTPTNNLTQNDFTAKLIQNFNDRDKTAIKKMSILDIFQREE